GLKTLASNQSANAAPANQLPTASMPMLGTPQFAQLPQNPSLSMLPQQQQPQPPLAPTPASVSSAPGSANAQQPNNIAAFIPKLREILQFPENHTMQDLHMAFQILQPQINQTPNKQGLTEMLKKLYLEIHKRQQQQMANMTANGQAMLSQVPQIQQLQLQQLQLRIQQAQQQGQQQLAAQMQAQLHILQQQQQQQQQPQSGQSMLSAAFTNSPHPRPATTATGPGSVISVATASASLSAEEMQMWRTLFQKTTRPFSYNGSIVPVSLYHAHAVLNQFKTRGDTQNEAAISKIILEIIEACKAEAGIPLTKEIVQAVLQENYNQTAPISTLQVNPQPGASVAGSVASASQMGDANAATALNSALLANATLNNRTIQNVQQQAHMQGLLSSPAMAMATSSALGAAAGSVASTSISAAAAQSPAQPAGKKQTSGKNTPSVANAKTKKKSQSPRTTAKPRKGPSPKPSPIAAAALVPDPAPAAAQVQLSQTMPTIQEVSVLADSTATGAETAPALPLQESISAETATQIVETIGKTIDVDKIKQQPQIEMSESDKKTVREHMALIGQLLDLNINLMPVIFLRTRNPEPIRRIYTINVLYKEQRRLLNED
ncbi:hypothetical protein GGI05_005615, partial [Coemansia sp. RSA 2603]